jgi:hypothetical protein
MAKQRGKKDGSDSETETSVGKPWTNRIEIDQFGAFSSKLSRTTWRSSEIKSERERRKCRIRKPRPGLASPGRAGSKESGFEHFRQTVQDEIAMRQRKPKKGESREKEKEGNKREKDPR